MLAAVAGYWDRADCGWEISRRWIWEAVLAGKAGKWAEAYRHDEEALLRPDAGTQAQFKKKKKKKPKTYPYDSSLSPALDWDGNNSARELRESLAAQVDEASRLDLPHRAAHAICRDMNKVPQVIDEAAG